jgi:hypothetical protein
VDGSPKDTARFAGQWDWALFTDMQRICKIIGEPEVINGGS